MVYWRLFYHAVWATKDREPLIGQQFANDLHNVIAAKAAQLGAMVHAVGGIEDHVHVAASIPPRISLAEFIQQLKGSSSHFINHEIKPGNLFAWQAEYGIVSFDGRQLDAIVKYVKSQQQHHQQRTTIPVFEQLNTEKA